MIVMIYDGREKQNENLKMFSFVAKNRKEVKALLDAKFAEASRELNVPEEHLVYEDFK